MTRCFVALSLPDPIIDSLVQTQSHLRDGRPVPPENLHLTLAFLGALDDASIEAVHEVLSALPLTALTLRLDGIEILGREWSPGIAARIMPSAPLMALQTKVAQACRGAGAELPRRRFHPHVTLCRGVRAQGVLCGAEGAAALEKQAFAPLAMGLYASTLRAEGAVYETLALYPFMGH